MSERETSTELKQIIAGLTQRIPVIEAPVELSEAPTEASEGAGRRAAPPEAERRSWLSRFFLGT